MSWVSARALQTEEISRRPSPLKSTREQLRKWRDAEAVKSYRGWGIPLGFQTKAIIRPSFDVAVGQSLACIARVVCDASGISMTELIGCRRQGKLVMPRQICMLLAKEMTILSYPEIGRALHRDHTTVMHSVRRASVRVKTERRARALYERCRARLEGR